MLSNHINICIENQMGHITLNRPEKLNSLSLDLVESLIESLKRFERDPEVKVIVLSGAGKAFCAGGDLETMRSFSSAIDMANYIQTTSNLTKTIIELDKYVISAVQGFAAGAGFSIALASDFIVADRAAKFALSFMNIGLIPDLGLINLLSERVPLPVAKEWITSGKVIAAEEAMAKGIINKIAEGDLLEETIEFSKFLLKGPPLSNKFVKYLLNHANHLSWKTSFMQENMIQTLLLQTEDHKEGLQAFFEKRVPEFKGM
ncbi:enoyl-CoA hydratase/isomerase family protein [Aneurinibacillus terranovensis]|uniref:enoyl-CoA hydratase/isomerase family protein n=1 Tax=Aneurinibacillus terranovensis TaxID=278991 RepID=UPI000427CEF9|nr:enoyl-CoA hydratase/isomerase family protein [Aneurinibacillus terranovensis]